MDEKMLLKEIVTLFTDNKQLREYCGITDHEADMCKEVLIEDKLFSELAVPGELKRSQVKKMVYAPFLKVINKVKQQIDSGQQTVAAKEDFSNNILEQEEKDMSRELEGVSVDNINISERTRKVLIENGITNLDKLTDLDFDKLKLTGNYGVKTIFELQQLAGKLKDSRHILSILRKNGK